MPVQSSAARTATSFGAGVLVGALLVWGWGAMNTSTPSNTATNTIDGGTLVPANSTTSTGGSTIAGTAGMGTTATNDLEIANQAAGMQVVVADSTVAAPTWLVVYELYQGKPVRALGATMFFPEYNGKGGIITLLRATQPGMTYFVGQSLDTGDHTFTPHVNKEVVDSNGKMIGTTFTTN